MTGTPAGRAAEVLCPFYRKNKATMIGCEGITEESSIRMMFSNAAACMQQMDIFCCARYKNCEVYEAVMKAKYADFLEGT